MDNESNFLRKELFKVKLHAEVLNSIGQFPSISADQQLRDSQGLD